MSIALAEQLKKEWTDKYVVVDAEAPELKRFSGLTGTVRTVNMNGRVLVEFDGAVDISWYDIDPSYLKVIPEPLKKKAPAAKAAPAAAAPKPAAAPAPAGEKKLSPLELARQQGAASKAAGEQSAASKAAGEQSAASKAAGEQSAAAKAAGDAPKKASPLELARQQGAAKVEAAAAPAAAEPEVTIPAPAAAGGGSTREKPATTAGIIELCRQQGAFKK